MSIFGKRIDQLLKKITAKDNDSLLIVDSNVFGKVDPHNVKRIDISVLKTIFGGSGGGHIIYDSLDNPMPSQPGLRFEGATVTNDSPDGKTVVSISASGGTISAGVALTISATGQTISVILGTTSATAAAGNDARFHDSAKAGVGTSISATGQTISVVYGTISGSAAQGNDARFHEAAVAGTAITVSLSGQTISVVIGTVAGSAAAGNDARFHDKLHAIASTIDHSSTISDGYMVIANTVGLPIQGTNTDTQVSAAVSASHAKQHDITSTIDHTFPATPSMTMYLRDDGTFASVTVSGGGHTIYNGSTVSLTKRAGLQFFGDAVADDPTNTITIAGYTQTLRQWRQAKVASRKYLSGN